MLEFTTRLSTLALVGLSACSFAASPASTDGQPATDASAAGDAADATWTDNSLLDFSRPGTSATDATATTWNTLEPNGIIPSFWLAHAAPGTVTGFTGDETQIDWDMLPRDIPTSINNLSVLPFNNNSPLWLDAASDKFVFWGEGELLLARRCNRWLDVVLRWSWYHHRGVDQDRSMGPARRGAALRSNLARTRAHG